MVTPIILNWCFPMLSTVSTSVWCDIGFRLLIYPEMDEPVLDIWINSLRTTAQTGFKMALGEPSHLVPRCPVGVCKLMDDLPLVLGNMFCVFFHLLGIKILSDELILNPKWRTHIFFRGVAQPPTSYGWTWTHLDDKHDDKHDDSPFDCFLWFSRLLG